MDLYFREYGRPREARPPLMLLHGLFGSSVNWHGIARRLEAGLHIIVPDLRNHGRSPHSDVMDYPAMAADVVHVMDRLGQEQAVLVGHSMGAKIAMWLALAQPERVDRCMAVDMAPVRYPNRFVGIFAALQAIDLDTLGRRAEAEAMLAKTLGEPALAQYLLQNLAREDGRYSWRMNLGVLRRRIDALLDFPEVSGHHQFPGQAWFLYGSRSDYVVPEYHRLIRDLFPHARLRALAGAGHWVYAEQPEEFLGVMRSFLMD